MKLKCAKNLLIFSSSKILPQKRLNKQPKAKKIIKIINSFLQFLSYKNRNVEYIIKNQLSSL
jgi:hypothetical protein